MGIESNLDLIRDWVAEHICSRIRLKAPDDNCNDAAYPYHLAHPNAFVMYFPADARLPPGIPCVHPAICVQLMEGEGNLVGGTGTMRVRLSMATWNPGEHGPDRVLAPDLTADMAPGSSVPMNDTRLDESGTFIRNEDGWRDVWHLVDMAIRELAGTHDIEGLRVVRERGVQYGPFTEFDDLVDSYPYWHAWVAFYVEHVLTSRPSTRGEYL